MRLIGGISLLAALPLIAGAPAADAALVYAPAGCLLTPPFVAIDGKACEDRAGAGDAVTDARWGAPEDEYIDPWTNVVYRLKDGQLAPIGLSVSPLGYVQVEAYRYGQFSGDPQGDFACHVDGEYCSPCPAVSFCVSWHVALAGNHDLTVKMEWLNAVTPTCVPQSPREHASWDYEGGSPVTRTGRTYAMMAPMTSCGVGEFTVELYAGGKLLDRDATRFGPTDCSAGVAAFMVDTWVYVDRCAPCEDLRHGDTRDLCKVDPGPLVEEVAA